MQRFALIHPTGAAIWYSEENNHFVFEWADDLHSTHSEFDEAMGQAIQTISADHGLVALDGWRVTDNKYSGDSIYNVIVRD